MIPLLQAEPEVGRFLSAEDRVEASGLLVPVRTVSRRTKDIEAKLGPAAAFAALVLDGMLMQDLTLGDRTSVRLLGPGDLVSAPSHAGSLLGLQSHVRAAASTRLALLGREVILGARRWPGITAGLHIRLAQQSERLAAQLVISQMPRVEDRLMALLWLLAESWGRVTPHGTSLTVELTHGTLGAMIGARRPTVTLALGELAARGALISQNGSWLLCEPSPLIGTTAPEVRLPELQDGGEPAWSAEAPAPLANAEEDQVAVRAELPDTVARLHDHHEAPARPARESSDLRA